MNGSSLAHMISSSVSFGAPSTTSGSWRTASVALPWPIAELLSIALAMLALLISGLGGDGYNISVILCSQARSLLEALIDMFVHGSPCTSRTGGLTILARGIFLHSMVSVFAA